MSHVRALLHTLGLFLAGQGVSALGLSLTLGGHSWPWIWLHGLAGPFVAVEGVTRFQYHPWWQNGLYLALALAVFVAPFATLRIPGRRGVVASAVGVLAWILFGLAQSIHHL